MMRLVRVLSIPLVALEGPMPYQAMTTLGCRLMCESEGSNPSLFLFFSFLATMDNFFVHPYCVVAVRVLRSSLLQLGKR